ncbi:serine/threonine protein kinase [Halomonas heilongjiangensis]|uniref:serine/threonine protein kinase n=1 Tax=Halomonas heilongjiangensis TaxID=1387883 RepID=UPI0011AFB432|nr:serine/threonine protein kinase [Halomonas heilongjiangensis]
MRVKKLLKRRFASLLGRPATHRRFIDHSLGVTGFLKVLKENDVNYVVLRWFEELPEVSPGEDIDILVADEDAERMTSYVGVDEKRQDIPCDIYSVSGLPGTSSHGMAYYPVASARQILNNAIWWSDLVRAPAPDEHFLSMCYHAVYHKGYMSGLPSSDHELNKKVISPRDHDYAGVIERLYENSSFRFDGFEMTLEGIDGVLEKMGWRPATDTLEKISQKNQWVRDALLSTSTELPAYLKGLTVFLVREKGVDYLSRIKEKLFVIGFDHILEGEICADRVHTIAENIRGGNWGKGPWAVSGGLPVYYFVTIDVKPIVPSGETIQEHVGLDNDRIPLAKRTIRAVYNNDRAPEERCNIIHSTDHAAQALEYLELINPDCISYVQEEARRKHIAFLTPYEVIEDLSKHARRAKVELISFHGMKAICKTFKEGRERYLQREVTARDIGRGVNEISSILEVGDNYIVIEFCGGSIDRVSKLRPLFHKNNYLPIWAIQKMKNIIVHYRSRGYEYVDFNPHNVLFDSEKGLKAIDFEFLQKADTPSDTLVGNFAWYSAPEGFEGDYPQLRDKENLYWSRWFGYTGLPLFFCIHDFPPLVLHAVRGGTFFYFSVKNAAKRLKSSL